MENGPDPVAAAAPNSGVKPSKAKMYEEWLSNPPTETQQKYWVRRGISYGESVTYR